MVYPIQAVANSILIASYAIKSLCELLGSMLQHIYQAVHKFKLCEDVQITIKFKEYQQNTVSS